MTEKTFNIIFKGEIVGGADEATVKANIGKMFKANDQVLARLFSGEAIAIKKNVDKAGAMKYRALMKKAGAICYAQVPGEPLKTAAPATPIPSRAQAAAPPVQSSATNVVSGADSGSEKEPSWSLAPVGSIIVEPAVIEGIEIPDIDSISLAVVGVDIIENPEPVASVVIPDVSSIDLAPVGSDVGDHVEVDAVVIPDISNIDLAPVGSDVADPVEHNAPTPPDVSFIDLAPVGSDVADPVPETPEPKVDISHISIEE